MLNRFEKCKNFKDLYNVFANVEGVDNFNNLTEAELERVAVVFEANLPVNAVLPVVPLNDKGYMYIWNVVVEEVETEPIPDEEVYFNDEDEMEEDTMSETINVTVNETMEGEEMKETINETAATTEEVKAAQAAKEFIDNQAEKVTEAVKKVAGKVGEIEETLKELNGMNSEEAEKVIEEKATEILGKIKAGATKMLGNINKLLILDEDNEKAVSKYKADQKTLSELVDVIDTAIHSKDTAWSKFKTIVKAIASYLLKLVLKAASLVLKVAFTLTVGLIKIGATAVVTTGKVVSTLNKEVVKPTVKAGKNAWATHKANKIEKAKATIKEAEEEEFQEVREALFGVDEEE